jgi:predicted anti-sigma-YlaC factor YlaD
MKCTQVQKKFSAYQDGELKPQERERVSEHLESCPACRERYNEMVKVWQALGDFQEILPEPGFYGQVVRKINESYEPRRFPRLKEVFQLFSPVAACTLLVIGLLIGTFAGNYLAGTGLISFQSLRAGKISEAIEVVSFQAFDPIPPGTLGDGYLRIVRNMESQYK